MAPDLKHAAAPLNGFLLHIFHRRKKNDSSLTCVIGRLENGETFAWTDDRIQPCFHIRVSDRDAVRKRASEYDVTLHDSAWTTMDGEGVACLRGRLSALRKLGELLQEGNIRTYEADLSLSMQYLIHQDLRGSVRIEGPWRRGDGGTKTWCTGRTCANRWRTIPAHGLRTFRRRG